MLNFYNICIEGIDKSGKDTLLHYIDILSNHKFTIYTRGLISNIAYSKIYNRSYEYNLDSDLNTIYVFLDVDYQDFLVRCNYTNEQLIDFKVHRQIFLDTVKQLKSRKTIFTYNTSEITPYNIAKEVIHNINTMNKEK